MAQTFQLAQCELREKRLKERVKKLEEIFKEWSCDCYSCVDRKKLNAKRELKRQLKPAK